MNKIKILLFEDNKSLRESISLFLNASTEIKLIKAYKHANNILDAIRLDLPDVILMDIEMPGTNGIEAVKIVKQHYPSVSIVMQTIFEDDDKIFDALCNGASGYILKTSNPSKYIEAIKDVYHGGAHLSPNIALKVLGKFNQDSQKKVFHHNLTARELEVLECLVNGLSYKMIADKCSVTYETVRFHMKNIYSKLHVTSMTEAVAKAIQHKIV